MHHISDSEMPLLFAIYAVESQHGTPGDAMARAVTLYFAIRNALRGDGMRCVVGGLDLHIRDGADGGIDVDQRLVPGSKLEADVAGLTKLREALREDIDE
jgi:hypothetical protein